MVKNFMASSKYFSSRNYFLFAEKTLARFAPVRRSKSTSPLLASTVLPSQGDPATVRPAVAAVRLLKLLFVSPKKARPLFVSQCFF
jgi:hypothetical protein